MSSMRSIGQGTGQDVGSVGPVQGAQPTPSIGSANDAGGSDALASLQKILQQIEGAANTSAIPAHQSW